FLVRRRAHHKYINGFFGSLLVTASSPRIDKRHFRQLTYHGDQYRGLSSVLTLFSFEYFSKKVNHWLLSSKNKSGNLCKEVYENKIIITAISVIPADALAKNIAKIPNKPLNAYITSTDCLCDRPAFRS